MASTIRKPSLHRREEIFRAVLAIIGDRGVTALTTSSLAAAVHLTSGALFRHFSSMDEILVETTRHALARVEETFPDASLPPAERLFGLARGRVRLLGSEPGLAWLVRSEEASLTLPEPAVALLRDVVARSRKYILAALRDGAAQGTFRDDIAPEVLLVPVMGTIHALIGMSGAHKEATGSRRKPEEILSALERLLSNPLTTRRTS